MYNIRRKITGWMRTVVPVLAMCIMLTGCRRSDDEIVEANIARINSLVEAKDYEGALELAFETRNMLDADAPAELEARIQNCFGLIYYNAYKRGVAKEYMKMALDGFRNPGEANGLETSLWNYALMVNNVDSVYEILSECRDLSRSAENELLENRSRLFLGKIAILRGEYEGARLILDSVSAVAERNDDIDIDFKMTGAQLMNAEGNYDGAIMILNTLSHSPLSIDGKVYRYSLLNVCARNARRYEEALAYSDSLSLCQDSIQRLASSENVDRVEHDFSMRLLRERELRKLIIVVGVGLVVLLFVIIVFIQRSRRHKENQLALVKKISQLNLRISELSEKDEQEEDGSNEKEGAVLEKLRLNREFLMAQPECRLLQKLNLERNADDIDRRELKTVTDTIVGQFADICALLKSMYPSLTSDDALYCIFSFVGLSKECLSVAMAASDEALRRRKSRIKQKMPQGMFEGIFHT
ncbi:hypothetical protein [uncultured Duncaniella sp.]|uniref:hypothetical protein n=2 Tax=uncultured Duncaniella sp. TaxID=2768039 RepID=UPI0026397F67|nr:hypothetical protein [uncultured Duncaniella sp.]